MGGHLDSGLGHQALDVVAAWRKKLIGYQRSVFWETAGVFVLIFNVCLKTYHEGSDLCELKLLLLMCTVYSLIIRWKRSVFRQTTECSMTRNKKIQQIKIVIWEGSVF
jgi:hypothetical protein